ncbi:hypothetical protein LCGC14_1580110, partial [marine sediment metagenome]
MKVRRSLVGLGLALGIFGLGLAAGYLAHWWPVRGERPDTSREAYYKNRADRAPVEETAERLESALRRASWMKKNACRDVKALFTLTNLWAAEDRVWQIGLPNTSEVVSASWSQAASADVDLGWMSMEVIRSLEPPEAIVLAFANLDGELCLVEMRIPDAEHVPRSWGGYFVLIRLV